MSNTVVPAMNPTAPYPPSSIESKHYYYGIPSRPRLVARSSSDVWVQPTGLEAYFRPKELSPVGLIPLCKIWETDVGPDIVRYLDSAGIRWTSLDPVRIGYTGEPSPPVIIWIGVVPGSLSAEAGIEVATHCRSILSTYNIVDIHVEIRESIVTPSASDVGPKLYKPAPTFNPTAKTRGHFSTTLGFSICAEATPFIEGSSGFYFSYSGKPGDIYLVTARHIIFHPDTSTNDLYQQQNTSQRTRNVLILSDAAVEKHINALKLEIKAQQDVVIPYLKRRLEISDQADEEFSQAEQYQTQFHLEQAQRAIVSLNRFGEDISRNWKKQENRILGHVTLSPPIDFGVGEEGFTEDWAVIRVASSKIDSTNFVGNAIDLGTTIPIATFTEWMSPPFANPSSFEYPGDRLLKLSGIIPDNEMWMPSERTLDHDGNPCIMVIKRGSATGLTVGRLNGIRSYTRRNIRNAPGGAVSKEVAVLPRTYKSGAFSEPGDSGSAVFDGKGRLAGMLTSGSGDTDVSDCTYLTSIEFILRRLQGHGIRADLYPSLK